MIGESVVKTSRSGTRLILIRLRLATTAESDTTSTRAHQATSGSGAVSVGLRGRPRRAAGEGEEHVVEGRAAHPGVVDLRRRRPRAGRAPRAAGRDAAGDRHEQRAAVGVERGRRRRRAGPPAGAASSRRAGSVTVSSRRSPPIWALSWSAVPRAITCPLSITAMSSASTSASSRYCVVSSRVVPSATSCWMTAHMLGAAARVEARGRLVEEQHRRVGHQRAGEVETASHAAGVRLGRAVGGVDEVELRQQLAGALAAAPPAQVVEPADHVEVLEAGEVLVDRGVLPGQPDAPADLLPGRPARRPRRPSPCPRPAAAAW